MKNNTSVTPFFARLLLSFIFIISGLNKLFTWGGTNAYMAAKGMPLIPFFHITALIIEIGGGLCILLGYKSRIAGIILFLYLIPVTLIFHNFWAYTGMKQQHLIVDFLKNMSIMGGLLLLVHFGSGPLSLDNHNTVKDKDLAEQKA
ncbi:MAG TPA: DoxX family protein [Balneolales bacterium]|nr:DoxX family protein [Balneolales bacterium]